MSSFVNFYCNQSLTGHFLLEPSLKVGRGYQRIFSPIERSGCQAVAEVVKRIGLFIILPLGAILSSLLIPFGLATKGIAQLCSSETSPVLLNPEETPDQKISLLLKEIREKVDDVEVERLTQDDVGALEALLNDEKLNGCSITTPDGRNAQVQEFWDLKAQVSSFNTYLRLFEVREQEREVEDVEGGFLINVADNGDCLFAAFAELSLLNNSEIAADGSSSDQEPDRLDRSSSPERVSNLQEAIQASREQVVDWMENHLEDRELQDHLKNSLMEDLLRKGEQLQEDKEAVEGLLSLSDSQLGSQKEQILARLEVIKKELEELPSIGTGEEISFEHINTLLPDYFARMRQQGTFGGAAELYALSTIHEVAVEIYNREEGRVVERPFQTINGDKYVEKPPRKMVWENNHYKAFVENSPDNSDDK